MTCDDSNDTDWDGCTSNWVSEYRVNQFTGGDQRAPAVALFPDGGFVIVWEGITKDDDSGEIFGRLYNAAGFPAGNEFQVNSQSDNLQIMPGAAAFSDGSFAIVWFSMSLQPGYSGIMLRRYASNGAALGDEYTVQEVGTLQNQQPAIAPFDDDSFVIAWRADLGDGNGYDIYARLYGSDGNPEGGQIHVQTSDDGLQQNPDVAALQDGNFLVAWESCPKDPGGIPQDGSDCGIFASVFDSAFAPVLSDIPVNSNKDNDQRFVTVASRGDRFCVLWVNELEAGFDWDISGQHLLSGGTTDGAEFVASTPSLGVDPGAPDVSGQANGSFVAAFQTIQSVAPGAHMDVVVQRFDQDAGKSGTPLAANLHLPGEQRAPSVGLFSNGRFVVVWESCPSVEVPEELGQDGDGCGIFVMRFEADGTPCALFDCSTGG